MELIEKSRKVRLGNLPNGSIFTVEEEGTFVLKSEYRTLEGTCECYIIGSGEMFWGNCKTVSELNRLLVTPVRIKRN